MCVYQREFEAEKNLNKFEVFIFLYFKMFLFAQLLMLNNFSETNLSSANKKKMSKFQFVVILQFFYWLQVW
jgi:hypothetical protein